MEARTGIGRASTGEEWPRKLLRQQEGTRQTGDVLGGGGVSMETRTATGRSTVVREVKGRSLVVREVQVGLNGDGQTGWIQGGHREVYNGQGVDGEIHGGRGGHRD